MPESLEKILLVVFGGLLGVLTTQLNYLIRKRKDRYEALLLLRGLLANVTSQVDHGLRFKNKDNWAEEINEFATSHRRQLPELYVDLKKVAWQIQISSFLHEPQDNIRYCCDELESDLATLELKILRDMRFSPLSRFQKERINPKKRVRQLLKKLNLLSTTGLGGAVGAFVPEGAGGDDPKIEELQRRWKCGDDVITELRRKRNIGDPLKL